MGSVRPTVIVHSFIHSFLLKPFLAPQNYKQRAEVIIFKIRKDKGTTSLSQSCNVMSILLFTTCEHVKNFKS